MRTTDIGGVAALMLGPGAVEHAPLPASHNHVYRLSHQSGTYLLKRFPSDREQSFVRERRLNSHLVRHGWTATPRLLATHSDESGHYALYEFIEGESLSKLWDSNSARIPEDLRRLGVLLGELHAVPLQYADLTPEETLFTRAYFDRMSAALDPSRTRLRVRMERCFERVSEGHARLGDVVVHGDYGPHQIVVGQNERWYLLDFEFAVRGPFADDLGACEVRLARGSITRTEPLIEGYRSVCPLYGQYDRYRAAFMAYNLMAIMTYSRRATTADRRLLERLLSSPAL